MRLDMSESVQKNVVLNCIRIGVNILFPIIIFPYISKILGPDNIGKVNFANSVINYFVMFATLGIPSYGVLQIAKARKNEKDLKESFTEIFLLNILLVLVVYMVFFISLFVLPKFKDYSHLLIAFSLNIIFTVIGVDWLYGGLEEFGYITKRSIFFKLVSLICVFFFIRKSEDYYAYAYILVGASVGSSVLNIIHARKYFDTKRIKKLNYKRHIIPILTFFAASVAGTINANTDSVMLGFFCNDYAVGIYSFSVKVKLLLTSIMTAAFSAYVPHFASYISQNMFEKYKEELRKLIIFTVFLASALSVFFIVFVEESIYILGGSSYVEAKLPMMILCSCVFVLAFTWSLGVAVLQPIGREKKFARVMGEACFVNVIINAILIPVIGVLGAAIATLLTETFNAFMFYWYSKDFLGNTLHRIGTLRFVFSSVVSAFIVRVFVDLVEINSDLMKIVICFSLFICVHTGLSMILFKELKNNINQLISSVKNAIIRRKRV